MMKLSEFRLDLEALLSQSLFGHGFLHYGYWENGQPTQVNMEGLGQAQIDYFEKLCENIPDDVKTILDVGSGTGANAVALTQRNYAVDCICPSQNLNKLAQNKLPESSLIHECMFEDFEIKKTYDALLFAESFHYIDAEIALQKAQKCTEKYVLIFDYFRKKDSQNNKRISHNQFCHLLQTGFSKNFKIVHDTNVTQYILPTFYVLDTLSNQHLKPFIQTAVSRFKKEHRFYGFVFSKFLKKIAYFGNKKSISQQRFEDKYEYRIVLLKKI